MEQRKSLCVSAVPDHRSAKPRWHLGASHQSVPHAGRGANPGRGCSSHRRRGGSSHPAGKRSGELTARESINERSGWAAVPQDPTREGTSRSHTEISICSIITVLSTIGLALEILQQKQHIEKNGVCTNQHPKTLLAN